MSRFIPEKIRRQVARRASFRCEYCLIHQDDLMLGCQIDHIISLKHGGSNRPENLAFCCLICNSNKGSDIGTRVFGGHFTRFFNPRTDVWAEHFQVSGAFILPKSEIGEGTIRLFQFNNQERIMRREQLLFIGRWPDSD